MPIPTALQTPLVVPVVAAPMFIASGPDLVTAQCQAGVIGSFPALNARPIAQLADWLDEIGERNATFARTNPTAPVAPFAVNLIVHRSNERLDEDLRMVVGRRAPIVITSLGARAEVNEAVHSYGGIVLHDVVNVKHAHKAIENGADGLIAVGAGAGGHTGSLSPFALLREIREWFDGPLLLSGAIAHGSSILGALAAGADFAYVGSAFLATTQASVQPEYKQMVVDSVAGDVVNSDVFTGISANYLRGSIEGAGLDPEDLRPTGSAGLDVSDGAQSGPRPWRDIWGSGQGIGSVAEVMSVADVVGRLADEYRCAAESLARRISGSAVSRDPQAIVDAG